MKEAYVQKQVVIDEIKDKFIFFNANKNGRISEFMNKYRILEN